MSKPFSLFKTFNNHLKKQSNNIDIGYNVIVNKDSIPALPECTKRKDLYYINIMPDLINKINNKININEKDITILDNKGDYNCYHRILSQYFNKTENFHIYYRKELSLFIEAKKI